MLLYCVPALSDVWISSKPLMFMFWQIVDRTMMPIPRLFIFVLLLASTSFAWVVPLSSRISSRKSTALFAALPENYQAVGDELILEAGASCGASSLDISWKGGKVTVVVKDNAFLSSPEEDGEEDGEEEEDSSPSNGVDVTVLARAINGAFDQDEVGLLIAETHEIEVTTPGAPEELLDLLSSPVWESYKGFDVQAQFMDPKTKKLKTIDGRLHDRTNEFTVLNIKGRMKKLKNESVLSVKLPKAKREK